MTTSRCSIHEEDEHHRKSFKARILQLENLNLPELSATLRILTAYFTDGESVTLRGCQLSQSHKVSNPLYANQLPFPFPFLYY